MPTSALAVEVVVLMVVEVKSPSTIEGVTNRYKPWALETLMGAGSEAHAAPFVKVQVSPPLRLPLPVSSVHAALSIVALKLPLDWAKARLVHARTTAKRRMVLNLVIFSSLDFWPTYDFGHLKRRNSLDGPIRHWASKQAFRVWISAPRESARPLALGYGVESRPADRPGHNTCSLLF